MAKIHQQLPPGLKTRAKNKETHPAQAAGVTPKPRRSQKEAEDNCRQLAQAKQDKKAADLALKARVAEIEDQMREEDTQRDATANHPPRSTAEAFRPPRPNLRSQTPALKKKASISPVLSNELSDDSGNEYVPPPAPENKDADTGDDDSEGDDEGENEVDDDEEQEEPGRCGRNKNPRRSDISNLRKTDVASGTPVNGKRKAEELVLLFFVLAKQLTHFQRNISAIEEEQEQYQKAKHVRQKLEHRCLGQVFSH
ncbi:hypothetical protein H0H92_009345 [Tricholoma furcatifolium]|nr:hypothetical protein H0H92_009345 [Tricholoma furcatifolium]